MIEKKSQKSIKKEKKIVVTINLISIKLNKIVYFKNIVVRVNSLRILYSVVCLIT